MINDHDPNDLKNNFKPSHSISDVSEQIYGSRGATKGKIGEMSGFARNAEAKVVKETTKDKGMREVMSMHGPESMPITYQLAREYSISDEWLPFFNILGFHRFLGQLNQTDISCTAELHLVE